jgi:SMODS and SLOG-associating 2TM effector domain 3/SMODS and SLOG-associating 2TM effector domain 1
MALAEPYESHHSACCLGVRLGLRITIQAVGTNEAVAEGRRIEYPALLHAAEGASAAGQRWYNRLIKADLSLIVIGALVGALSSVGPTAWEQKTALVSALIIGTGAVMRWVNRSRRPDRDWFDGRAVAETLKNSSWRYMMRADPYAGSDKEADTQYIADLREVLHAGRDVPVVGVHGESGQITDAMRRIREEPFDGRRAVYLQNRVKDQIGWYSARAASHRRHASIYFAVGLGGELAAIAWAIFRVTAPNELNLIGVFTSLAAAATALNQLHHHDELGRSYALAAQELSAIFTLLQTCEEQQFTELVREAEGAISREHTMWIAKRR